MNKITPMRKVVVIGDVLLDRTELVQVLGPTPENRNVLCCTGSEFVDTLGGAGNVATNVLRCGAKVELLTCVARDAAGSQLTAVLAATGLDYQSSHYLSGATSLKHRFVSNDGLVLRVD